MSLISILMPTYNNAEFIAHAVEDIIGQTYENWELIIVNDGSTDQTESILAKYNNNEKIKILHLPFNKGICNALNIALSISKGKYILRCDADDRCNKDRIEKQLSYLLSNKLDLVGSSVTTIDKTGEIIGVSKLESDELIIKKLIKYESPILHIWLCKKEIYDDLGEYRFSGVEDYDFILRAHDKGFRISNLSDYYGVFIRKHNSNTACVAGWTQRKKFNLVRKLHNERVKHNREISIFNLDNIDKSVFGNKIHNISNALLIYAIGSKSVILKGGLVILSALLSPYQFQYLYNRLISRLIRLKN